MALGTEIESPQTGERLIFRSTADSSGGELFRAELTMQPGDYVVRSHIHPRQEESFVVLEGRWGWKRGSDSGVAEAGETVTIPPGVQHRQWNAGDGLVRVYQEHRPALAAAEIFFETYYGLSRDGKLTDKGDIKPLQAAVLLPEVGHPPLEPAALRPGRRVPAAGRDRAPPRLPRPLPGVRAAACHVT